MGRLAIAFAVLIVAIIVAADTSNLGPLYSVYDFPNGDKVGHFVLFGTLTFLTCVAVIRAQPKRDATQVAAALSLAIAVVVTAEELSQIGLATRKVDALDLLAGYAGVVVAAVASVILSSLFSSGPPTGTQTQPDP